MQHGYFINGLPPSAAVNWANTWSLNLACSTWQCEMIRCHDSYNHKTTNLHKQALKLWQGSQNQCSHTKLFRQSGTENVLKPRTPRTCTNLKRPPSGRGLIIITSALWMWLPPWLSRTQTDCHLIVGWSSYSGRNAIPLNTLPTDQLFNLEFQFESVFNSEFQPKFGIQLGISIPMKINLGEWTII